MFTILRHFSLAPTQAPGGLSIPSVNLTCVEVRWSQAPSNVSGPITIYKVSNFKWNLSPQQVCYAITYSFTKKHEAHTDLHGDVWICNTSILLEVGAFYFVFFVYDCWLQKNNFLLMKQYGASWLFYTCYAHVSTDHSICQISGCINFGTEKKMKTMMITTETENKCRCFSIYETRNRDTRFLDLMFLSVLSFNNYRRIYDIFRIGWGYPVVVIMITK